MASTIAPQDLSIRQLQYVVAVADTLGFHRAAERCGISQPTLSSQIQKLEDVLGVRLFERDRRRVILIAAGEPIVAHARTVLVALEDLLRAARETTEPLAGTLRLGVIPTIAPYLLPWVTPAIAKRWPKLRLALVEEKTDALLAALRTGTLDAALLAVVEGMDDLQAEVVLEDPFVAALPSGHALAKKKQITVTELEREPVLLLEDGHCLREQALALCRRPESAKTDLRATSLATLVQMVSAGAGVTLLPSIAVDVENRRGQLAIRSLRAPAGRTICLAWRKTTPLAAALRELAGTMASAASRLPR
jgi:LysR family transcriptional regulator, hydrogen peroxide-inducible genes activator